MKIVASEIPEPLFSVKRDNEDSKAFPWWSYRKCIIVIGNTEQGAIGDLQQNSGGAVCSGTEIEATADDGADE